MAASDEKIMILKMLSEGKITADEADKLLQTLNIDEDTKKIKKKDQKEPKMLRVRVTDTKKEKVRANISVPISILKIGTQFGARFTDKIDGIDNDILKAAINNGEIGKIVDIFDDEEDERVEVYIE